MDARLEWEDARPYVLIIDRSQDSLEVLETALTRRGVRTVGTPDADQGLALALRQAPDLIVLDDETLGPHAATAAEIAGTRDAGAGPPVVLLGRWNPSSCPFPVHEELAKPYQYATLVRRIEDLLAHRGASRSSAA